MSAPNDIGGRIRRKFTSFLKSIGHDTPVISDQTNFIRDLDLTSDQGVDFVLDLCEEFDVEFPLDFNPFVHDSGYRGRRFGELVAYVTTFLSTLEASHATV